MTLPQITVEQLEMFEEELGTDVALDLFCESLDALEAIGIRGKAAEARRLVTVDVSERFL